MNSKNTIWMILLFVFLLIGALEIFLWMQFNKDLDSNTKKTDTGTEQSSSSTDINNSANASTSQFSNDSSYDDLEPDNHTYIFVGDSRYVAMSKYKMDNDTFLCENGVGRYFLKNNLGSIVNMSDSNTRIIIGLGVNDVGAGLECTDEYLDLLAQLDRSTDAEIYYMLVNPVNESLCSANGYSIKNSSIDTFNQRMTEGLHDTNIKILDTNSYLKEEGYTCSDGLHYKDETSEKIYQFIKIAVKFN
ncbi:MAG: hypothetical protein ACI4D8_05685 [Wujia sp.]